jgi:hypothetical protein
MSAAIIIFFSFDMILLLSWFHVIKPILNLAAVTMTTNVHQVIRRKFVYFAHFFFFLTKNSISFFLTSPKLSPA